VIGQHHGAREQQRGKNLDKDPVLSQQAEDQTIKQRHQRQIRPRADLSAPLGEEIADAVEFDMLGLGEIPGGIHDDFGLGPRQRAHGEG
jgi:hypothetical protein